MVHAQLCLRGQSIAGAQGAAVDLRRQRRGEPIGQALGTMLTLVLVGERPGLSASDSLGAYMTYDPKPGNPDSGRNCVSNIRDGGLPIREAAQIIANLVRDMFRTKVSGVALKGAVARLAAP